MRTMIATVVLVTLATPSFAIESMTSTAVSCQAIHAAIEQKRAVLLRYSGKSGLPIYDRAVAGTAQCNGSGFAERTYFPAADTKACPVLICAPTDLRP